MKKIHTKLIDFKRKNINESHENKEIIPNGSFLLKIDNDNILPTIPYEVTGYFENEDNPNGVYSLYQPNMDTEENVGAWIINGKGDNHGIGYKKVNIDEYKKATLNYAKEINHEEELFKNYTFSTLNETKSNDKVRKKFFYDDIELKIVSREEPIYKGSDRMLTTTKIIAPNGGVIPYKVNHKETLKSIVKGVTDALDGFKKRGADIKKELTSEI